MSKRMKNHKKVILSLLLAIMVVGPLVLATPKPVQAFSPGVVAVNAGKWVWEKVETIYNVLQKRIGSTVINNTFRMYANKLAYSIASGIAEGASGKKALFRMDSIKDSFTDAKEAAIGEFIGTLSETAFKDLGFNLCDPSIEVKLTLTLGLIDSKAPPGPKCNWRDVEKKWKEFNSKVAGGDWNDFIKLKLDGKRASDKDWTDFWSSFDTSNSDLGVAGRLYEELAKKEAENARIEEMNLVECRGFKDVSSPIAGRVKTHCMEVMHIKGEMWDQMMNAEALEKARISKEDKVKLGDILKDAGNLFMNTLSSKMLKHALKWGNEQLAGINQKSSSDDDGFRDGLLAQLQGEVDLTRPVRGADVYRDLLTVNFQEVENFNLLENFVICPDQEDYRHPDNCVMSSEFLQVLAQKKTVTQLIDEGLLDPKTAFIGPSHTSNNSDKCYRDGFCHHNLVKLRKAGIVPIGWELAAKKSPAGTAVTLGELIACFEDDGDCPYTANNPYLHLVDPNWVLKNPPARCNALVYSQVLESSESDTRQEYCADVQTCLREDDEGNCLTGQYGYCTRSENVWRLDADMCADDELYSGCLTFAGSGDTASYLEDSLEYCTADDTGCQRYSQEKDANNNWVLEEDMTIASASNDIDLFLNDRASDCPSDRKDCHEYIVMAANRGLNLLANGNFEYFAGNVDDGADESAIFGWNLGGIGINQIVSDAYRGSTALLFDQAISASIETGVPLKNRAFMFSFYGKVSADEPITLSMSAFGDTYTHDLDVSTEWDRYQIAYTFADDVIDSSVQVSIAGVDGQLIIDALQVEEITSSKTNASYYSDYGQGGRIFMGEERNMCWAEEVDCQGYTPVNNDPMVPAIISADDLCPIECVGYSSFAQSPNDFDLIEGNNLTEYYNFIPETALSCPSTQIGCEEFTNLDELADGGEAKEYYSYLRQCVQMDNPDTATYYTWEGSDVSGYQLKTWTTLKSQLDNAPCTNVNPTDPDGNNTCADVAFSELNDPSFEVAACGDETNDVWDDPVFNPNCREFFDIDGFSHFRLQDKIIYASNDCHPYRRSTTGQEYQAIPSLSYSCQAEYNGCRWYAGETDNNLHQVFLDNFENGVYSPWQGTLDLSNESLANNGHSIKISASTNIERPLANLQNNKAFTLSWWMKATGNLNSVTAQLNDGVIDYPIDSVGPIGANDWRHYQIASTDAFDIGVIEDAVLRLEFVGVGDIFLDNIILKEVNNDISLVKESWNTPASCDDPFEGAYLGCQAYIDTNGNDYTLKSFSSLCREQSIGCRAVIDTHNSSYPFAEIFNIGDYSKLTIPADEVEYLVPNVEEYCPAAYKGCSALGLPQVDQTNNAIMSYSTVYKINDPDNYDQSLCDSDDLYCQAYNSSKGLYYFKDPGTKACTYQKNVNIANTIYDGWFKTGTLDDNPPMGCSDVDGAFDETDLVLPTADLWAANCPEEANLCTEFKDPLDPRGCDIDLALEDEECAVLPDTYINQTECENAREVWLQSCRSYYYKNNDKIDTASCNGQFDQSDGCTLLYETNNWNGPHTEVTLEYNASSTYNDNIVTDGPVSPVVDPAGDSNVLVKVRKDRQCSEWLACKSSTAVFDEKSSSYKVICDAVDSCVEHSASNNITKCAKWADPLLPANIVPFDDVVYQDRQEDANHIAWHDQDYLGYSILGMVPIQTLVTYDFSIDPDPDVKDLRLVYENTSPDPDFACVPPAKNDLDTCGPANKGICMDERCWFNPDLATGEVKLSTRSYAGQSAPFANRVTSKSVQSFNNVNVCEDDDNACEAGYEKVTYGLGGSTKYYGQDQIPVTGLCIAAGDGHAEGDVCTLDDDCGVDFGRCAKSSKEETFLNWQGVCLEGDPSTLVPTDDDGSGQFKKEYCNQWYPVDQIQGAQSLYNTFTSAGFYSSTGQDVQMCALGEPYLTTEDRVYCGALDSTDEYCNLLYFVPEGSKINVDRMQALNVWLSEDPFTKHFMTPSDSEYHYYGSGAEVNTWLTSHGAAADEIQNNIITVNVLNPRSIALGEDEHEGGDAIARIQLVKNKFSKIIFAPDNNHPVISEADIAALYDAQIGYFYYDSEVSPTGADSWNDYIPVDGSVTHGWGHCEDCGSQDSHACEDDEHQVRYECHRTRSQCGFHKWRDNQVICNPTPYNYYVQTDTSLTQSNCVGDCIFTDAADETTNHGWGCMIDDSGLSPYMSNVATSTDPNCAGDLECAYKTCVWEKVDSGIIDPYSSHSCDDAYGYAEEGGWWYGPAVVSGCFTRIMEVVGTTVIWKPGIDNDFKLDLGRCLYEVISPVADLGPLCYIEPDSTTQYQLSLAGDLCDGLECYQQCQIVTSIDADGKNDKSWVRTDIWWRASQDPAEHNGMPNVYYYNGSDYALAPVFFNNIAGDPINVYWGSAEIMTNPVLTSVPLVLNDNEASVFFSTDTIGWSGAQDRLKYLLARFYNFTWDGTDYDDEDWHLNIETNANVNPDAGPTYEPKIYHVCGGDLCNNGDLGVTVNNQQAGDINGYVQLFSDMQFYYHAHPDHMPIIDISIAWGDGNTSGNTGKYKNNLPECISTSASPDGASPEMGFGGTSGACHVGYKTFYNNYLYNPAPAYECDGTAGKPDIDEASCYQPFVMVTDNWDQTTTEIYDGWVVIHRQ